MTFALADGIVPGAAKGDGLVGVEVTITFPPALGGTTMMTGGRGGGYQRKW